MIYPILRRTHLGILDDDDMKFCGPKGVLSQDFAPREGWL